MFQHQKGVLLLTEVLIGNLNDVFYGGNRERSTVRILEMDRLLEITYVQCLYPGLGRPTGKSLGQSSPECEATPTAASEGNQLRLEAGGLLW